LCIFLYNINLNISFNHQIVIINIWEDKMKIKQTLGTIVIGLALGLGACDYYDKGKKPQAIQNIQQVPPSYQTKNITGKIVNIDEDSFAISGYKAGVNFEFEHFRIKASDGKIYKLIFPGPSNYQVGDEVDFAYKPQSQIDFQDIIYASDKNELYSHENNYAPTVSLIQEGYFNADGIIPRIDNKDI